MAIYLGKSSSFGILAATGVTNNSTNPNTTVLVGGHVLTPGIYKASPIEPYYTMNGNLTFDAGGLSSFNFAAALPLVRIARSVPTSISISAIGVNAKIVGLGFNSEGGMEVPTSGVVAGWFEGAPSPGEIGPAIIVGHVDWNGKIGFFYKLKALKNGDLIKVIRHDGKKITYVVVRILTVNKLKFPTELVYGNIVQVGLRLITCGGKFDSKLKRHIDNVIVFAKAVAR